MLPSLEPPAGQIRATTFIDVCDRLGRCRIAPGSRTKDRVDLVIEHVGSATWEESIKCLKIAGTLVTCGATTGFNASIDLRFLFSRQLSLLGSYMGTMGELREVLGHVFAGRLRPVVDRVFPLKEIRAAHEYLEKSRMFGKVVLDCSH